MTFERQITEEEILDALLKGSKKSDSLKQAAKSNPGFLKAAYEGVLKIVDRAEEHFSVEGYQNKNNIYSNGKKPLTEKNIRDLFFCAVEAVQCLEELEPHIERSKSKAVDPAIGLDRHMKLLSAATVFRTGGRDNTPAMDIEAIIKGYRQEYRILAAE